MRSWYREAREEEVTELNDRIDAIRNISAAQLQILRQEYEPQIDDLIKRVDAAEERVANLISRLHRARTRRQTAMQANARWAQAHDVLMTALAKSDQLVQELQTQLRAQHHEIKSAQGLRAQLRDQDAQIEKLREALDSERERARADREGLAAIRCAISGSATSRGDSLPSQASPPVPAASSSSRKSKCSPLFGFCRVI